jgi:uncharacterized metal-binding protein YceD (DUF177 family)
MHNRKEYTIQFVGLSVGEHEYEYNIKDAFFDDFEYSEIKHANINMMVIHFDISGTVNMDCDRCTTEFDLPITGNYKLIVKMGGHETGNEDDDIITVATNEHELDLTQYIYEYITLSLPIKRVHPDDENGNNTCNKEVLSKLENFLIEEEKQDEDESDPRWNDLKNIKLN